MTPFTDEGNVIVPLSNIDFAVGSELGLGTFVDVDISLWSVDKLDTLVILLEELLSKVVFT